MDENILNFGAFIKQANRVIKEKYTLLHTDM